MSDLPLARSLYLADLADKLVMFETGRVRMDARAYRLFARRLSQALAGLPDGAVHRQHGAHAAVVEALEGRYFTVHGRLSRGTAAASAALMAAACIARAIDGPGGVE